MKLNADGFYKHVLNASLLFVITQKVNFVWLTEKLGLTNEICSQIKAKLIKLKIIGSYDNFQAQLLCNDLESLECIINGCYQEFDSNAFYIQYVAMLDLAYNKTKTPKAAIGSPSDNAPWRAFLNRILER